ncbi:MULTISPECIES: major capsid protein [unclassified Neisseria]|uniref:major capsid protein n=1 Tax=unclassified Neisseria TaxID=2623750 RepID=UPI0010719C2E|nr:MULTISPECIES: major capsid protein [unclassified Neisseria]MBF0804962.1 major capsid protein [Neisseria sp. 19428wB4_WF04]TFU39309.1 major capsid protein [Neisseria sp. WF04]
MPLSNESKFGVKALTTAVNKVPATPTQIRDLNIFEPQYLTTTYVDVEYQEGRVSLVQSKQRGQGGQAVDNKTRRIHTFKIPHLPEDDIVRADDVQNLRAFGSDQAATVEGVVQDKLADGKLNLEYTREHLMLGALQGKILDADGTELYDLYKEFGITRGAHNWKLGTKTTEVGAEIDKTVSALRAKQKGAMVGGWVALCGLDFLTALKYHDKIKPLYERYRDGAAYREGSPNPVEFEHNGIKFIQYIGDFGTKGAKIAPNEAILLPVGRKLYTEAFAPADMNATVNTRALPYYASREKLDHDKGWSLHMQSNPLPIALRPELVVTLSAS